MSKKERDKAGLHKKISSIFSGVLIPQKNSDQKSSGILTPEYTESAEPQQLAQEAREPESQNEQILPEAEPAQESKFEPDQEAKDKPVSPPKFMTEQESKVIPIQESEIESSKDSKAESIQETNVEPVQEFKAEQANTPKFMTAQESKVIPIQESEIESSKDSEAEPIQETNVEPVQELKAEQANTPKFVTAQESKVIPIQESEVEPAKESENESDPQSKSKTTKKPKVIAVRRFQKADIDNIAKKVSKKSSVVKVSSKSSWKQITSKLCAAKPGASNTKQKAMVVMVPVLFIFLVIFVLRGGVFGTSVHNAEAGDENDNAGVVSAGLNVQIDWEIPEPYPTTLRDPMQLTPVVTGTNQAETKELVQLIVKSILYSEDNSSAIISNRIVHEGDQIQGASITKIYKDSVEFEMNGKKWTQGIQR
ncbi:MAG: hypothetical protein H8D56_14055 [Planctomycetes bacterium]|nr:hypothetical protein [Planctomycetota bacterium]MBL7145905.1 hypothetical protein [Phycisphaerae bacterium]